jgi:hypothetical protein
MQTKIRSVALFGALEKTSSLHSSACYIPNAFQFLLLRAVHRTTSLAIFGVRAPTLWHVSKRSLLDRSRSSYTLTSDLTPPSMSVMITSGGKSSGPHINLFPRCHVLDCGAPRSKTGRKQRQTSDPRSWSSLKPRYRTHHHFHHPVRLHLNCIISCFETTIRKLRRSGVSVHYSIT